MPPRHLPVAFTLEMHFWCFVRGHLQATFGKTVKAGSHVDLCLFLCQLLSQYSETSVLNTTVMRDPHRLKGVWPRAKKKRSRWNRSTKVKVNFIKTQNIKYDLSLA
jgi:hypothetical protein